MEVAARPAGVADVEALIRLYRDMEAEQVALKPMWRLADGLAEPAADAFREILDDPDSYVVVGALDGTPLGFAWARTEALLPQADGERVGVVRLIYTVHAARGVGVGDAMINDVLEELRSRGLTLFDARVSPGHRHAKNFFESNGFSARLIIMHHADDV